MDFKLLMGGRRRTDLEYLYDYSITDYHNLRSKAHVSFFYYTLLIEVFGIWVVKRLIL
jgi:hypothetical protein